MAAPDNQPSQYTYDRLRIVDFNLDNASLPRRCPLDNAQALAQPAELSVGRLDMLPTELLNQMLVLLDLPTLTAFRRVSHRARNLVDSLPEYRAVYQQCPNVLRAIISLGADSFSLATLHRTLSTSKCESCDSFGNYLYLITCKRVCYFCYTRRKDYLPLTLRLATMRTKLSAAILRDLPSCLSIPGRYTSFARKSKHRVRLIDRTALGQALIKEGSSDIALQDFMTLEPRRYMAVISVPFLESQGGPADWGVHCSGCRGCTHSGTHFRFKFTRDGLAGHLRKYGEVGTLDGRAVHLRRMRRADGIVITYPLPIAEHSS